KERRIADKSESTATLATNAARKAIEAAGIQPKEIDLIICGTITPEMQLPSTACFVGAALGLNGTPGFDVSAACSGFLYSLEIGSNFVKTGRYKNVLVIGAEVLSRITDYKDRGSCILFGDGAGAEVLLPTKETNRGVLYSSIHADGSGWEFLYCRPGSRFPIEESTLLNRQH